MLFALFAFTLSFAGVAVLAHLPDLTVSSVTVSGNRVLTAEELASFVEWQLSGAYGFFIPKSNALLYPRTEAEAALLKAFPRLKEASLSLTSSTKAHLAVVERVPYARWCRARASAERPDIPEQCYYIDANGFIYGRALIEGEGLARFSGGIGTTTNSIGAQLLAAEEFRNLTSFMGSLDSLSLSPSTLELRGDGDISIMLQGGPAILVNKDDNLAEEFSNLQSVLQSPEFQGVSLESIEYFDLRFGNKIYFKEK